MRAHNERLVLSILQGSSGLGGAEIAGKTGLSAQTVSVINRAIEPDRLLICVAPLIDSASLLSLERALTERGLDARRLMAPTAPWSDLEPELDAWLEAWLEACGAALAQAALGATALLDTPRIIIEGRFPPAVKRRLVESVRREIQRGDLRGLWRPDVIAGAVGADARAIGGACLPLLERFLLDHTGAGMRSTPLPARRQAF